MQVQMTIEGERELDFKKREAYQVISKAILKTGSTPIVINFSGGKDSLTLLDLVRQQTDNFICVYAQSGIEFPEAITFAKDTCKAMGHELVISTPEMYMGGFFERLAKFKKFPTIRETWCSRDLKFRAEGKMLKKLYGKHSFYKLNGVRRFESSRRNSMHISTKRLGFIKPDFDIAKDFMVFPILNWTNENIRHYLKENSIRIPVNPLYEKYKVSGCYYCPFYQPSIYKQILSHCPNIYDKIIEWENKLNQPAGSGFTYIRDLKLEIVGGKDSRSE